jgi:predicted nucleic acid-binding protein
MSSSHGQSTRFDRGGTACQDRQGGVCPGPESKRLSGLSCQAGARLASRSRPVGARSRRPSPSRPPLCVPTSFGGSNSGRATFTRRTLRQLVLDASVVLKWFGPEELLSQEAGRIRMEYERGDLIVLCPRLVFLEILNVASRRWGWDEDGFARLAETLEALGFEAVEPSLTGIAAWAAHGLTAYDAAYVAVAEERRCLLVTDDDLTLSVAGDLAAPLAKIEPGS